MEHSYDGDWANNNYWLEFPYNFNPDSTYWEYSFFDKTIRNRGKETHEIRISSDKTRSSSWIVGYHSSLLLVLVKFLNTFSLNPFWLCF